MGTVHLQFSCCPEIVGHSTVGTVQYSAVNSISCFVAVQPIRVSAGTVHLSYYTNVASTMCFSICLANYPANIVWGAVQTVYACASIYILYIKNILKWILYMCFFNCQVVLDV